MLDQNCKLLEDRQLILIALPSGFCLKKVLG